MPRFRSNIAFQISGGMCLTAALALLVLPLKWLMAALAAAAFHELCHYLAARLCGSKIRRVRIGVFGADMETEPMSRGRELVCALAGPAGGLLLLLLARWFPRLAVCAGFHSAYNLLPLYPLDGGRALRCGAAILLPPPAADAVSIGLEWVVKIAVLVLGVYASFVMELGLIPVFYALLLIVRTNPVKFSCKQSRQRVQ